MVLQAFLPCRMKCKKFHIVVMLTWHQALFTRTNNRASTVNCAEADDGTMGPGMRVWMCMGLIGQSICSKGLGEA